ncbi:hypothetical protein N7468_008596 [Penicillium chermesinum]|uniref:Uncharacterized protein n=1 Tax=Penicillium chermesinum TaxID=63820 RepID=A0A9W9NQ36_9EURO|nr:uncharacterized protein N7468_008596 [Penicillium chermesinum]KAJ5224054.1 hypothetical protein N7468_008596 [Penicillium chermesinum]
MASVAKHLKTAIVTGGARGIGQGIALKLASTGYDVTIADLPSMSGEATATAKQIEGLGRKAFVALGDVSVRSSVERMVADHVKNLGPLFTMVANAGVCEIKPLLDVTEEDMRRMYSVNVFGLFNCYQAAAKQMISQGTPGRLIGGASKFAVRGLTQGMAMEMAPYGIRVNAYCPGIHATPMWDEIDASLGKLEGRAKGETLKKYSEAIALGRTGTPEDVAKLVAFLASDESEYMTGQSICIDGGIIFT